MTLSRKYYCSPEIHARETERIFQQCWLCVGSAASIPNPGDWFRADMEGESLIVTRDREGVIHAFYNVCRHRGTRLCSEHRGTFGKYVVCPYHAWSYALDGSLAAAPHMDDVPSFEREDYGLHEVALGEWEGQLFVNLASDPEPLEKALAPLMGKFARWELPQLEPVHHTVYEIGANWKLVLQNYSECYHCPSLHPQLNRLTPFRDASNDLVEGRILGGPMRLGEGAQSMTMSGKSCGTPLGQLDSGELREVHYYVLFPNMFLSLMPDYALIHRIHRLAVDRTRIECEWLFRPEAIAREDFDPSDAIQFWDTTNQQDWAISEQSQAGIASRAYAPGPYSDLESMVSALDREYLRTIDSPEA